MNFKEAIGKHVVIFTKKDFRFEGELIDCDESFIEIQDSKKNKRKDIAIDQIAEMDVL